MNQYIRAQLLHADLISIDKSFTENGLPDMQAMLLLKQAFIAVANFGEFENSIRAIYQDHPELSYLFKRFSRECDFTKYLRNRFVGHINQELIIKAIEWRPELKKCLDNMDDEKIMYVVNLSILETAINTYVDVNGSHRVFDSETDLMYPPDNSRFLIFLSKTIQSSIGYLNKYIELVTPSINKEIDDSGNIQYVFEAAKTIFKFIKK